MRFRVAGRVSGAPGGFTQCVASEDSSPATPHTWHLIVLGERCFGKAGINDLDSSATLVYIYIHSQRPLLSGYVMPRINGTLQKLPSRRLSAFCPICGFEMISLRADWQCARCRYRICEHCEGAEVSASVCPQPHAPLSSSTTNNPFMIQSS